MVDDGREAPANLREVIALIWTDATGFVRFRLVVALLLIMIASATTALGPVALKLVVDRFTGHSDTGGNFRAAFGLSVVALIGSYVLSQWLARTAGETRGLVYARAELRMTRLLSQRLFAHIMRLPLKFHLERQTGADRPGAGKWPQRLQHVLYTLVFTILPVAAELCTVVIVLSRLEQRAFLGLFFRRDSRLRAGVLVLRHDGHESGALGLEFPDRCNGGHDRQHPELRNGEVLHRRVGRRAAC